MKTTADTSLGFTEAPEAVPGGASLVRLGISEGGLSVASWMEGWRQHMAVSSHLPCGAGRGGADEAAGGPVRPHCNSRTSNDR